MHRSTAAKQRTPVRDELEKTVPATLKPPFQVLANGSWFYIRFTAHRPPDRPASRERLFAIMLMSYEAELHSQAGRARRRRGVPERCAASQLSSSFCRTRGDSVGDQPSDPGT